MSRPVSATSESLPWSWSGERNVRRRPCPGPTAACSRRRHRRFANIYSFIWPSRFIVARSAARLRRIVGPLATPKAVAGQFRQRDSIGHIRAYPGISGHIRAYPGISGHIRASSDTRGRSRAVSSVAGSRPSVRHGPYRPSPGTALRMGVACRIVRRRIACGTIRRPITGRPSLARVGDLGVSAVPPVGRAEHPSSAMSRPNSAL